jgi:probable F420-dependent oxidoreductase
VPMIQISLQGRPASAAHWLDLARALDADEFNTLYVADHPGTCAAPFVALAAAAVVTERIRLGTCVLNVGRWDPFALASEVATLDVLSGGRSLLGLGAGHTPAEWSMSGTEMPLPGVRIARLAEVVEAVRLLLAGDEVSMQGAHVDLRDAVLNQPRPIQNPIPVMVGGNGQRLLRLAATCADIVGVTGLGVTLADGHSHEANWDSGALDSAFDLIRTTSDMAGRMPSIEVLVQHVEFTDDAEASAHRLAEAIPGASAIDILEAPFVWIGTSSEIVQQLRSCEERWRITRYVVREGVLGEATEVLRALRDAD